MIRYSFKRILYMIPVTIAVIFLVYLIMYLTPGDPVALLLGGDATPELIAETRQKLGITDSFLVQFGRYLWNLLHGDFGMSWYTGRPVAERLFSAIPFTVTLSLCSMLVALLISVPLGILAAVNRTQRSSMLEVLSSDYIRTARAKGVSRFSATYKHALRNAVLPSITVAGLDFSLLVGGSVAIETVFAIPGVGRLMIDNIKLHDTPTVIGCMVFVSVMVSIIDILYGLIDPRIKAQYLRGAGNGRKEEPKEKGKSGETGLETVPEK